MTTAMGAIRESQRVSLHLMAGEEADAAVEIFEEKYPDVRIERQPAYVSVVRDGSLEISVTDIAERLGHDYDVPTFLVILSSYIGRIQVDDDTVALQSEIRSA